MKVSEDGPRLLIELETAEERAGLRDAVSDALMFDGYERARSRATVAAPHPAVAALLRALLGLPVGAEADR